MLTIDYYISNQKIIKNKQNVKFIFYIFFLCDIINKINVINRFAK